jgi:hypothetical protein
MMRAFRFVNELRTMLTCVLGCATSILWASVLIFLFLMMFAVFFVNTSASHIMDADSSIQDVVKYEKNFGSVQDAILTLFQGISGGMDWGEVYDMVNSSPAEGLLFIVLVVFFQLAVLNIVTSHFVEKALRYAQPDAEHLMLLQNQRDIQDAKGLMELARKLDDEHTGTITFQEFKRFMENEEFRLYFEVRNIDIADAEMFFELLVAGSAGGHDIVSNEEQGVGGKSLLEESVDFATFVDGCFRLKGAASSMDLRCLDFELKLMHANQERFFAFCSNQFQRIYQTIDPDSSHHKETYKSGRTGMEKIKAGGTAGGWADGGLGSAAGVELVPASSVDG